MLKLPQNDQNYYWTQHIKMKMLFYRLSEQKIKSILKSYDRKEKGIAPNTIAAMKRNDTPRHKEEIWVMYAVNKKSRGYRKSINNWPLITTSSKLIMISAWRYPGISQTGKALPIPDDILTEIQAVWFK